MSGARVLELQLGDLALDLMDWENNGFAVDTFDPGAPTIREVTSDLPGQDGSFDQTAYFGPRVVQIGGTVLDSTVGSRWKALDALAPFLRPNARPTLLYAVDTDVDIRTLTLRVAPPWSNPVTHPVKSAWSVQWKCPDPIAYGLDTNEVDIPPSTGSASGRIYPLTFPRTYPPSYGGSGEAFVVNGGTYPTFPMFRIFGPWVDPAIYWLDPVTSEELGTQIVFSGLTIDNGDYIEVDTKAQTVVLNGDPEANRYSFLDFAATSWGPLQPATNLLRCAGASASAPALVQVLYQDAFIQ